MQELLFPAFIAGILTFLAPCTLPLVPGFLAFIGGVSDKHDASHSRVIMNASMYVLGFSVVFIALGTVFSYAGLFLGDYRLWFARLGGLAVVFFGVFMVAGDRLPFLGFLQTEKKLHLSAVLTPGRPGSAFLLGATFALGWTPCVGPVLGSILLLATTTGEVLHGTVLLAVFSLGLAVPFLLLAATFTHAAQTVGAIKKYLPIITKIGGVFLIFMGLLMFFGRLEIWSGLLYDAFGFMNYDALLQYL